MGLFTWLKNQDMFGHQVELQFNGDGSTHKTLFGGFISFFLVKTMISIYIFLLVYKLMTFGDDKNLSYIEK